jgi:hypothetical protein
LKGNYRLIIWEASYGSSWSTFFNNFAKEIIMVADKEITSWDIVREPNRILLEEDYGSRLELLIYFLTWMVELGLCFAFAISYLRG